MLKISRLDINLPADLVQTCAGVRESQLCKFIATNNQGEFQHSIEVRGKQNNVISLELSNLTISFQDGHFVAEVEQALKVFQGRSEVENEAVIPDAHVTSSQNAELESSHSNSSQAAAETLAPHDIYTSQATMASSAVRREHPPPIPGPSPRRLFKNISRKRPAETVTSGELKFPRIIQEERLPILATGTTNTSLSQQSHSETQQTTEVSVEETRHDLIEVKVETDDDDFEDKAVTIDDSNTNDSVNQQSSSYSHVMPLSSHGIASQHVVIGHGSSVAGQQSGQQTAGQHTSQSPARREDRLKHYGPPIILCSSQQNVIPANSILTIQTGTVQSFEGHTYETVTLPPDARPLSDESLQFLSKRILQYSGPVVSVRGLQRSFSSSLYSTVEIQQAMVHLDNLGLGKLVRLSRKILFIKIDPDAVNADTLHSVSGQCLGNYKLCFEECHKQTLSWSDQVKGQLLFLCQKIFGDQYAMYVRGLIGGEHSNFPPISK